MRYDHGDAKDFYEVDETMSEKPAAKAGDAQSNTSSPESGMESQDNK